MKSIYNLKKEIDTVFKYRDIKTTPLQKKEIEERLDKLNIKFNTEFSSSLSSYGQCIKNDINSYDMIIRTGFSKATTDFITLHEKGHILYSFQEEEEKHILLKKLTEKITDTHIVLKLRNIAADMEVNSKIFKNDYQVMSDTIYWEGSVNDISKIESNERNSDVLIKKLNKRVLKMKKYGIYCDMPYLFNWETEKSQCFYLKKIIDNTEKVIDYVMNY
jgi:hypothetical protein